MGLIKKHYERKHGKDAKEAKGKDGEDFVSKADKIKLEEAKDKK